MLKKIVRVVYNDFHGYPLERVQPLAEWTAFLAKQNTRIPKAVSIADLLSYSDVVCDTKFEFDSSRSERILKQFGRSYWVSSENKLPPAGFAELGRFSTRVPSPLMDLVSRFKKKKRSELVWIYVKKNEGSSYVV